MDFYLKETLKISVGTQFNAIGVLSMKWTERLKEMFKEDKTNQAPLPKELTQKNRKEILARKIMQVMKKPYPATEENEASPKKPKP